MMKMQRMRPSTSWTMRLSKSSPALPRRRKRKPKPPGSTKLNEAILRHALWRTAHKGLKNRRSFNGRLNQIARKLGIPENQPEWNQPTTVATNLRKANKTRRTLERVAFTLKVKEREENTIKNTPEGKNKETALKEYAHQMRQRFQFKQIRDSVRKTMSRGITHIIHPEPHQGYPYQPEGVTAWKEEHDQGKIEKILLERNHAHFSQASGTPFTSREILELPTAA